MLQIAQMMIIVCLFQIFLRGSTTNEARGSSSATDLALLAILEGMRADQRRVAEEQARRDRDQDAINAAMQARQDEL